MAKKEVYTCDQCGDERREANHWFVALANSVAPRNVALYNWPEQSGNLIAVHLCGQECVLKFVNHFLSK